MELNITAKWILGIIATILLGALGSGLWSLVFDPLFKKFAKFFMSVSTLGIKSIQNKIYAEAAKGHRERSVKIIMFILLSAITIPAMIPFAMESKSKKLDDEFKEAVRIVKIQNPELPKIEDKVYIEIEKIRYERRNKAKTLIVILTAAMWLALMFQYIKITQIESVISYFERCINICRPYFKENEHNGLLSRFALIETREDYYAIMENLETIARRGGLDLP